MPKQITFDETARRALERGVDQLAGAVVVTLGPRGRHVVLEKKFGGPTITNDGVTIAREIELEDPFENLGAQLAKNVATKTNDVAGDGTTTATVLAQALVAEGLRNLAAGANPTSLGAGMVAATEKITEVLRSRATPVDGRQGIAAVGAVASRDQTIGDLIGEAMEKVGEDGVITVEEASTLATELEVTEGLQFDKGYISPYFVTDNDSMEAVLEDAQVLLNRDKISAIQDLLPLLEKAVESGKPLLIIAEDVEAEALSTLVVNSIRKTVRVAAVKAPFFGDRRKAFMDDLAAALGATVVNPETGTKLADAGLEVLGSVRRAVITKDTTTFVEGGGSKDAVDARIAQIRREIDETDSDWDREKLQERLAKLSGGVAVIKVGAATETEMKERKHRIEDAIAATRAAVEEGIVPGGGSALLHASAELEGGLGLHRRRGHGRRPWCAGRSRRRCGPSPATRGSRARSSPRTSPRRAGAPATTPRPAKYGDLMATGIIDPVKVTRSALENATSIARMVLTTESAVVDKPADEEPAAGGGGHGHGHGHGH